MIKPTFLTKKQREELAAQKLIEDKQKIEQKKKEEAIAHERFITGKNLEERLKQEKLQREKEERERIERQKQEKKDSKEHDHEIEAIREHYLGGGDSNRSKQAKPSERAAKVFQFEWKESDDTGKNDLNPLYNNRLQINALFGRGYIAGVDQKEQRRDSNFLGSLSQKRLGEVNGNSAALTEDERRQREQHVMRLNADLHSNKRYLDGSAKNSYDCHWSEKPLSAMTERDWRIFREDFDIRIKNGKAVNPLRSWDEANLPSEIMRAIEEMGYEKPSPIQRQAIPVGLISGDIIGIAETGSGKTAAFLIPLLCYLLKMDSRFIKRCDLEGPLAIVMAPTRELALQIYEQCVKLAKYTKLRATAVVGGQSIEEQGYVLRQGVEIVVGTPGRMVDCLEHSYMVLNQCNYVVLDEADRMVEEGFESQILAVLDTMGGLLKSEDEQLLEQQLESAQRGDQVYRVTAMFSATMPTQVEKIAKTYLRHPVMVRIGDEESGKNKRIEQRVVFLSSEGQKKSKLSECMQKLTNSDKTIIFVNEKKACDAIGWSLEKAGHAVGVLHGGKSQDQREEVLDLFRSGQVNVLVATDVAGRGLDIPDVTNVINYDLPKQIENYSHRIGRTGRAGKFGIATSFLTEEDTDIMFDLKNYLEATNSVVPLQLQKHPAAQAAVGTRDEKGKLVSAKKDSVMYASR